MPAPPGKPIAIVLQKCSLFFSVFPKSSGYDAKIQFIFGFFGFSGK